MGFRVWGEGFRVEASGCRDVARAYCQVVPGSGMEWADPYSTGNHDLGRGV